MLEVAAVAVGAVAQRVAGIGFGLVAAPAFVLAEGPERGVPLVITLNLVANVLALPGAWPDVDVRRTVLLAVPALAVAPLAVWSLTMMPPGPLQVVTGALVLCAVGVVAGGPTTCCPTGAVGLTSAGLLSGYMNVVAGVGGPAASLRQVWQSAAEAGRMAAPDTRKHLMHSGASAAIGLFTGPSADSTALVEYRAMTGEQLSPEVRALLALSRGDSTGARRMLAEPDTIGKGMPKWTSNLYTRPLAAQAWFLLGDYQRTLHMLRDFEPEVLKTGGFDSRWGMLGRVRLLRAAAYEQLGRRSEALAEYRQVLAQWKSADESLKPFVRQAEQGVARLGEA